MNFKDILAYIIIGSAVLMVVILLCIAIWQSPVVALAICFWIAVAWAINHLLN
jgi:hypothetical protein